MRLLPALLISSTLLLTACSDNTYRRTMAGAGVGAVAGGLGGAVCCKDPVDGIPIGIVLGAAAGAVIGYIVATVD